MRHSEKVAERRARLQHLKSEASSLKSRLIELHSKVAEVSLTEANKLDAIIWKLERWQNR